MINTKKIGNIGEKIAQKYLINKGYEILETNYYTKRGEIDIIAKKFDTIIFIEVKTRTNLKYGTPAMAINFTKKRHIKLSAKTFLYLNRVNGNDIRFDVIEIFIMEGKCKIEHLKGVM